MNENVKRNIDYQVDLTKRYGLLKLYSAPMCFCIIDAMICIIIQMYVPLIFLIAINLLVFLVVVATILSKYQKKMVVLSCAIIFTDTSLVFCVLSFLILVSLSEVSYVYIVFGIVLYLLLSVMNILNASRRMKSISDTPNSDNAKYKKVSINLGIFGGVIGVLIAKTLVATVEYQNIVMIFAMISLFVSLFCSVGAQLYLSYYWLNKEENNDMSNNCDERYN